MTANILAKNCFFKSHTLCNGEEYDDDNDDDVNDNDDISDNDNAGDDCDGDDYISADWAKQTIVRKVRPQSERGGGGVAKPGVSI